MPALKLSLACDSHLAASRQRFIFNLAKKPMQHSHVLNSPKKSMNALPSHIVWSADGTFYDGVVSVA
jgi:hypothetical protein